MEVLKSGDAPALVTNIEVMNILSKRLESRAVEEGEQETLKRKGDKLRHRDFIESKVFEYLQTTPCANVEFGRMPEFVSRLKGSNERRGNDKITGDAREEDTDQMISNEDKDGYGLTDAEILQILNHMPSEPVDIHLLIEDLMSRMEEEKQSNLLQLISEYSNSGDRMEEQDEEVIEEELQ